MGIWMPVHIHTHTNKNKIIKMKAMISWSQWYIPIIASFERPRRKDFEFKVYMVNSMPA